MFLRLDCSGGYSPSVVDAMRSAIGASNTQNIMSDKKYDSIDFKDAFKMATLGGSKGRLYTCIYIYMYVCSDFFGLLIISTNSGEVMLSVLSRCVCKSVFKITHKGVDVL